MFSNHPAARFIAQLAAEDAQREYASTLAADSNFMVEPWANFDALLVVPLWRAVLVGVGINACHKAAHRGWATEYADHVGGEPGDRLRLALMVVNAAETRGLWAGDSVVMEDFRAEVQRWGVLPAHGAGGACSAPETAEQRDARRYEMCIEAGLKMPADNYSHLPRGIGKLALREDITRQAFGESLKAHIRRMGEANGR